MRHGIAHRIRNIDRARARFNHFFDDLTQKIQFRTPRVFARKLDIIGLIAGITHR